MAYLAQQEASALLTAESYHEMNGVAALYQARRDELRRKRSMVFDEYFGPNQ